MKTLKIVLSRFIIPLLFVVNTLGLSLVTASPNMAGEGSIFYTKPGATGDCLSWESACDLNTALLDAISGDEVWVAEGTYFPTTSGDRIISFGLKTGIAIYGGFPPEGGAWESRDWQTHPTVLSGDIGVAGDSSDNSYHVIYGYGVAGSAILDGFTITHGNGNGVFSIQSGWWGISPQQQSGTDK